MDYKALVERLKEWNENLIYELCADDVLTCDDLCDCMEDCIVIQAINVITDLLARAEAAEARAEKAERERDAAVERIRIDHWCDDCKYCAVSEACRNEGDCSACNSCYCRDCDSGSKWEWKGLEE